MAAVIKFKKMEFCRNQCDSLLNILSSSPQCLFTSAMFSWRHNGGFQGCIYTNVLIHSWKCALLTSEDTFMHLLAHKDILIGLLHTQLSAYFKILALAWKGLG